MHKLAGPWPELSKRPASSDTQCFKSGKFTYTSDVTASPAKWNKTGATSREVVVKVWRCSWSLHYNDTGNGEKVK